MFERILIPLDGSPLAEAVLSQVAAILRRQDSEVLLLRVVTTPISLPVQAEPFLFEDRSVAESYLRSLERRLSDEGIRVRARVELGPVAGTILDVAERERSTLIAMATHGRTGLARWVFGSVSEKVIRATPIPLLILRSFGNGESRTPLSPIPFRTLLAPVSHVHRRTISCVREFAELFQSRVVFLHVTGRGEDVPAQADALEGMKAVSEELLKVNVPSELVLKKGDPAHEILEACVERRAELIAMSTHGSAGLSRWALGSVTEKLLRAAPVPMLIVRTLND
jgi:nucleotide-binding universal stress UspA family protein